MSSKRKIRTTEITIERTEVLAIRKPARTVFAECGVCAAPVQWVTPNEVATIMKVSTRTVYRRIEAGKLHFAEVEGGRLFICLRSLAELLEEND